MTQSGLNFEKDINLPIAGKSPYARHASASGAAYAVTFRGESTNRYLSLLAIAGERGMSDCEAADALGRAVGSICSVRDGVGGLVIPTGGYEMKQWPKGRITRRARYTLAKGEQ